MMMLTSEQQYGVDTNGNLAVIACPGSGKTRLIVFKATKLVDSGLRKIIIATFTRESAGELEKRIESYGPEYQARIQCTTLHMLAINHLKQHANLRTMVSDEEHHTIAVNVWEEASKDLKLQEHVGKLEEFETFLNNKFTKGDQEKYSKQNSIDGKPQESDTSSDNTPPKSDIDKHPAYEEMYKSYCNALEKNQFTSVGSVISVANKLIIDNKIPPLQADFFMLDEAQDTDTVQLKFVLLHTLNGMPTLIVGDDDQSLYSFRNALGPKVFTQFLGATNSRDGVVPAKICTLTKNFRSKKEIVDSCSKLISHNVNRMDKMMESEQSSGAIIKVKKLDKESDKEMWLLESLRQQHESPTIAVISRTNGELDKVERTLLKHGFPYNRSGSTSYFDSSPCKQFLALLQAYSTSDAERMSLATAPFIGGRKAGRVIANAVISGIKPSGPELKNRVKIAQSLVEALKLIHADVTEPGLKALLPLVIKTFTDKNFQQFEINKVSTLSQTISSFKGTLKERLKVFQLEKNSDQQRVTLLTAHSAKGREFNTVIIVNVDNQHWPYINKKDERDISIIMEEERRLFFVAMSRAISKLYMVAGTKEISPFIYESGLEVDTSPFFLDTDEEETFRY